MDFHGFWIFLFDFCLGFGHFADLFRIKFKPWFRGNSKDPFEATPNKNEERQGHRKLKCSGLILRGKNKYNQILRFKNIWEIHRNRNLSMQFFKISARDSPPKKNTSKKSASGWKTKHVLSFFSQNLICSETKIHGRKGCFLRSLYGQDHDGWDHHHGVGVGSQDRQGKWLTLSAFAKLDVFSQFLWVSKDLEETIFNDVMSQ